MAVQSWDAGAPPATIDRLLSALSDERRRHVLEYLGATDAETVSMDSLAEYVASRQDDAESRDDVRLRLHHVDLPNLADAGLVDYHPERQTVQYRRGRPMEVVEACLRVLPDREV